MLFDRNVELSALAHCWNNPALISMFKKSSFYDPIHSFFFSTLYDIVVKRDKKVEKMTQLMVSEYLAQNKEEILEYLKNQEENLYYNLESYIHQNLSYLSIYNPNEENYVLNRIYEYEQKREAHAKLVAAVQALEFKNASVSEVASTLYDIEPVTADRVMNFWESLDEVSKDPSEYIKFSDPIFNYTFKNRSICTVFADTGCLKTAFTLWMVIKFLEANPDKTAMYFEKEMPREDIVDRLITYYCQVDNTVLLRDKKKYYEAMKKQYEFPDEETNKRISNVNNVLERLYIVSPDEFDTAETIVKYVRFHKPDMWVLDFMTQLNQQGSNNPDFNRVVMQNSNILKTLAQYGHPTLGIIVAQINKNTIDGRRNKVPHSNDIEWSSNLLKISAQAIALFKPDVYMNNVPEGAFIGVFRKQRVGVFHSAFYLKANAAQNNFSSDSQETKRVETWYQNYLNNIGGQ